MSKRLSDLYAQQKELEAWKTKAWIEFKAKPETSETSAKYQKARFSLDYQTENLNADILEEQSKADDADTLPPNKLRITSITVEAVGQMKSLWNG